MSCTNEFLSRLAQQRRQLAEAAGNLSRLAGRLALAHPVDLAEADALLRQTLELSGQVRGLLVQTAAQVQFTLPDWGDDRALDGVVQSLSERLRTAQEVPRARLLALVRQLTAANPAHR